MSGHHPSAGLRLKVLAVAVLCFILGRMSAMFSTLTATSAMAAVVTTDSAPASLPERSQFRQPSPPAGVGHVSNEIAASGSAESDGLVFPSGISDESKAYVRDIRLSGFNKGGVRCFKLWRLRPHALIALQQVSSAIHIYVYISYHIGNHWLKL
jgi:hypothetical protein